MRLLLWKLWHFILWLKGPTAKGVLLSDYKRWKETGEWSDQPPKGWPWNNKEY